jgi:hypothetical protein
MAFVNAIEHPFIYKINLHTGKSIFHLSVTFSLEWTLLILAAVLIFNFCNFIQHQLPAGFFQIPPHRQCETLPAILKTFRL